MFLSRRSRFSPVVSSFLEREGPFDCRLAPTEAVPRRPQRSVEGIFTLILLRDPVQVWEGSIEAQPVPARHSLDETGPSVALSGGRPPCAACAPCDSLQCGQYCHFEVAIDLLGHPPRPHAALHEVHPTQLPTLRKRGDDL